MAASDGNCSHRLVQGKAGSIDSSKRITAYFKYIHPSKDDGRSLMIKTGFTLIKNDFMIMIIDYYTMLTMI